MQQYIICRTCHEYITLEQVKTKCWRCGKDLCVHCMHICKKCEKKVCPHCYSGEGLCNSCANLSFVSNSWKQAKEGKGEYAPLVGGIKTLGGLIKTAYDWGKARQEKRNREYKRKKLSKP